MLICFFDQIFSWSSVSSTERRRVQWPISAIWIILSHFYLLRDNSFSRSWAFINIRVPWDIEIRFLSYLIRIFILYCTLDRSAFLFIHFYCGWTFLNKNRSTIVFSRWRVIFLSFRCFSWIIKTISWSSGLRWWHFRKSRSKDTSAKLTLLLLHYQSLLLL